MLRKLPGLIKPFCQSDSLLYSSKPLQSRSYTRFRGINKKFDYKLVPQRVGPMAVPSVQVVGGTPAIPPALLYTDNNNKGFLFNAGEGIQRMILESPGLSIIGVGDVIMTRCEWETCASIPGVAMFRRNEMVVDKNYKALKVWGDERAGEFLKSTVEELLQEENIVSHLSVNNVADLDKVGDVSLQSVDLGEGVVCFVARLPVKKGSVDKVKLKALKLQNKQISQLMKDGSLLLDSGSTVQLADVSLPAQPPAVFIVIDCRSEAQLKKLASIDLNAMYGEGELLLMAHFSPLSMLRLASYQAFCKQYTVDHLLLAASETDNILYECSLRNAVFSSVLPIKALYKSPPNAHSALLSSLSSELSQARLAQPLLKYNLYSGRSTKVGWNTSQIQAFDFSLICSNTIARYSQYKASIANKRLIPSPDNFHQAMASRSPRRSPISGSPKSSPTTDTKSGTTSPTTDTKRRRVTREFPDITFLGTSSTYASTYRAVSGILLESDYTKVLLDCGEMTYGQMVRLWGKDVTLAKIKQLDLLYISHIHFDHCAGTLSIAKHYYSMTQSPLLVLCPARMLTWYNMLSEVFKVPMTLVSLGSVVDRGLDVTIVHNKKDLKVSLCPALHCYDAWSISLSTGDWRVSYSGDTMPNPAFVQIGVGSDVLIHEATLESTLSLDALDKRHSTVAQAVDIGEQMKSKYTLLTHFSLRYQKYPPIINEVLPPNVAIAHDLMTVTSANISSWCESTSALPIILPEQYNDSLKNKLRVNKKMDKEK